MIFDSFYLLFKSQGVNQVKKDLADVDKQLETNAAKGKKLNEAELKQQSELFKRRTELKKQLSEQKDAVDEVGKSFTKLADSAALASTAILAYSSIKAGIINATELNGSLLIQSRLLGQNVRDLQAYANATEAAGGSQQDFLSFYSSVAHQVSAIGGRAAPSPAQLMTNIRGVVRGLSPSMAMQRLDRLGVPEGLRPLLMSSDADFANEVKGGFGRTPGEAGYQKLRDQQRDLAIAGQNSFLSSTQMASALQPVTDGVIRAVNAGFAAIEKKYGETGGAATSVVGSVAGAGVKSLGALWLLKKVLGIGGAGAAAAETGGAATALEGAGAAAGGVSGLALGGIFTAAAASTFGASMLGDYIGKQIVAARSAKGKTGPVGGDSMSFWMSQGYSREQAAGIAANEMQESSGNPGARNHGHVGLYQWDASRRALILKNTGIDVATASAADQRRAAAWEFHYRGDDKRIMGMNTPGAAAAAVNKYFEVSGEDPAKRMMMATQFAGGAGGNTANVKIDAINIHTQATDTNRISSEISNSLRTQIRMAISSNDDAVAY